MRGSQTDQSIAQILLFLGNLLMFYQAFSVNLSFNKCVMFVAGAGCTSIRYCVSLRTYIRYTLCWYQYMQLTVVYNCSIWARSTDYRLYKVYHYGYYYMQISLHQEHLPCISHTVTFLSSHGYCGFPGRPTPHPDSYPQSHTLPPWPGTEQRQNDADEKRLYVLRLSYLAGFLATIFNGVL